MDDGFASEFLTSKLTYVDRGKRGTFAYREARDVANIQSLTRQHRRRNY